MGEQTKRGLMAGVRCNGASNHSDIIREIDDFYATPPVATTVLIKYLNTNYTGYKKRCILGASLW